LSRTTNTTHDSLQSLDQAPNFNVVHAACFLKDHRLSICMHAPSAPVDSGRPTSSGRCAIHARFQNAFDSSSFKLYQTHLPPWRTDAERTFPARIRSRRYTGDGPSNRDVCQQHALTELIMPTW
jgi:hypothetical protein